MGGTNFYQDGDTSGTTNGTHYFAGGGGSQGRLHLYSIEFMTHGGAWEGGTTQNGTGSDGASNQKYGAGNGNRYPGTALGGGGAGGANTGGGGGAGYRSVTTATGTGGSGIVVLRWVTE
jgi:hypothetical protein